MISRAKAHVLRALIVKASASLPDEDALDGTELFPLWSAGIDYAAYIRVRFENMLYRCVQTHTSHAD